MASREYVMCPVCQSPEPAWLVTVKGRVVGCEACAGRIEYGSPRYGDLLCAQDERARQEDAVWRARLRAEES